MAIRDIGIDQKRLSEIAGEMKTGFETLADRYGHGFVFSEFKRPEFGRALLCNCGAIIQDVLIHGGKERQKEISRFPWLNKLGAEGWLPRARNVIDQLLAKGASAVDLADFTFECTRGIPASVKGILDNAGFTKEKLGELAERCTTLAEEVNKLNCEAIPGPHAYYKHHCHESSAGQNAEICLTVPAALEAYSQILHDWPPKDAAFQLETRKFGNTYPLAYFCLYLDCFKQTSESAAALLRLMLAVRFGAQPPSQKLLGTNRNQMRDQEKKYPFAKFRRKGALSARGIQAAVERFFQRYPDVRGHMILHVSQYLFDPHFQAKTRRGDTFLAVLEQF
jgi:hypothetical protein